MFVQVKVRVSKWLKELEEYFFGSCVAYDNVLALLDLYVFRTRVLSWRHEPAVMYHLIRSQYTILRRVWVKWETSNRMCHVHSEARMGSSSFVNWMLGTQTSAGSMMERPAHFSFMIVKCKIMVWNIMCRYRPAILFGNTYTWCHLLGSCVLLSFFPCTSCLRTFSCRHWRQRRVLLMPLSFGETLCWSIISRQSVACCHHIDDFAFRSELRSPNFQHHAYIDLCSLTYWLRLMILRR